MSVGQTSTGSAVNTSLNAFAVAAGSAHDNTFVRNNHSMQVVFTGAPTTLTVKLELSLDNATWFTSTAQVTQADTSGKIVTVVDTPARYIRANCTAASGGTSPTLKALVASI